MESSGPQVERGIGRALYTRRWTEVEIDTLREMELAGATDDAIGAALLRTSRAVAAKAYVLGLRPRNYWTTEEKQILHSNADKTSGELVKLLPGRTAIAICQRRSILGIKSVQTWSKGDEQLLRDNMHMTDNDLGVLLGKNRSAICGKRLRMGLRKKSKHTRRV